MTAKCALCGDEINFLCDGHFEIAVNKYACLKCLNDVEREHTKELLGKRLDGIKGGKFWKKD